MTFPTIHMNGTSGERLLDDISRARHALNKAYETLKQTAPNGRDYYLQGPNAIHEATQEHMDRLRKIDLVMAELEALAGNIYDQVH